MGKKYEQQTFVASPPEQVAQLVQQVVSELPKVKEVYWNPPVVTATTSTGMASWGEVISVQIDQAEGGSDLRIRSACSVPTQLIDFGKNRKNVELILQKLTAPAPPAA